MSKLSNWFSFMLESELKEEMMERMSDKDKIRYVDLCSKFWEFKGEDRNIMLEDLSCKNGLLYKKMCMLVNLDLAWIPIPCHYRQSLFLLSLSI